MTDNSAIIAACHRAYTGFAANDPTDLIALMTPDVVFEGLPVSRQRLTRLSAGSPAGPARPRGSHADRTATHPAQFSRRVPVTRLRDTEEYP
jgi:hypothetical protein